MSISNLTDEELMSLYKSYNTKPNDISSLSDDELMKLYKPQPVKQSVASVEKPKQTEYKKMSFKETMEATPEELNENFKALGREKLKQREEWEKAHPVIAGIQKDYQPNYRSDVEQWKLDAKYGYEKPAKEIIAKDIKKLGLNLVPFTNITVDALTGGQGTVAKQGLKQAIIQGAKQGAKTGLIGGSTQGITSSLADNGLSTDLITRPLQYGGMGLVFGSALGASAPVAIKGVEKVAKSAKKNTVKPQVTKEVKAEISKPVQEVAEQPNVIEETIKPNQAAENIKTRSLEQSILDAKGTPKEIKEIIKEDLPTYKAMSNEELIKQAAQDIEGNFDNELVRLASAKDFDALDYEKSHQIAQKLFGMGEYQKAVDLIDNVSENATKKGQAIQALSLWSNMTPEGAVYKAQKLIKEYNKKQPTKKHIKLSEDNIKTLADLQTQALNTTDELAKNQALAKSAKYIAELVPKNALQKLKAYRNISLLLNPKTLGRNIVGNALFNAVDTAAKGLAAPIDATIGLFTKQRTRVVPNLAEYGRGLAQGAKTGYQEALQGIDTRGLGQRFDLGSGRTFKSKPMQALETALDIGLRTPDRAFYEATFAESVDNIMRARGLTKPTQEVLEQAEQEALEAVFQNKSALSNAALRTRKALNTLGTKDFGFGDVLIPYAQTPANLAQQGINYSPLGLAKSVANLVQGNQRQASLDAARALVGTGLIGTGYGLSKAGYMTPSQFSDNYKTNKTIKENLQPLGIRPDQIGNAWYAPFQPLSIPLSVGNAMAYGEDPLQAGINTVVDLPFMQNVSRGLRDLQEGNYAQAGVNVLSSIPSQFVPTALSQVAQVIDPYQRETYDPDRLQYGLNQAIAKIPFASQTLPEKIDVTGQPVVRYKTEGGRRLFDIFLNPTFINEKTNDPVLSELKYIYDVTNETKHFMPSVDKKLKFTDNEGNEQNIILTGEKLSEYQKELGQRMYDEFNYVMDLPRYAEADEDGKIKLLEKAKKLVKAEVDDELWNKRNRNKKRSYTY